MTNERLLKVPLEWNPADRRILGRPSMTGVITILETMKCYNIANEVTQNRKKWIKTPVTFSLKIYTMRFNSFFLNLFI